MHWRGVQLEVASPHPTSLPYPSSSPHGRSHARLLSPKDPLLQVLAAHIPFETAIGLNGRVWFKAASVQGTIALQRVIEAVDDGTLDATDKAAVDKTVKRFLA